MTKTRRMTTRMASSLANLCVTSRYLLLCASQQHHVHVTCSSSVAVQQVPALAPFVPRSDPPCGAFAAPDVRLYKMKLLVQSHGAHSSMS